MRTEVVFKLKPKTNAEKIAWYNENLPYLMTQIVRAVYTEDPEKVEDSISYIFDTIGNEFSKKYSEKDQETTELLSLIKVLK